MQYFHLEQPADELILFRQVRMHSYRGLLRSPGRIPACVAPDQQHRASRPRGVGFWPTSGCRESGNLSGFR